MPSRRHCSPSTISRGAQLCRWRPSQSSDRRVGAGAAEPTVCDMAKDIESTKLPIRDPKFAGKRNRTLDGSKPDSGAGRVGATAAGRPTCCSCWSTTRASATRRRSAGRCQTPTLTRLADQGLRYNRFHVTALCSPTRAALLSGRNHHAVGFGSIAEFAGGWPGYDADLAQERRRRRARSSRAMATRTAAFGKWHLTPDNQQGPAGPFDRWPNGLGLRLLLGLPRRRDRPVRPGHDREQHDHRRARQGKDYYLPDDMADRTIDWIRDQKAQSPTGRSSSTTRPGASHAPHHVPREWADRYKGKFDQGWDRLREETFARQKQPGRHPSRRRSSRRATRAFPAWDTLSGD